MENIIYVVLALIIGSAVTYFLVKQKVDTNNEKLFNEADQKLKDAQRKVEEANRESKLILTSAEKEGESIKKDKLIQAKEKFIELKSQHEQSVNERERKIMDAEKRVKDKEHKLNNELRLSKKKKKQIEDELQEIQERKQVLQIKEDEVVQNHKKQVEVLEKISGYSAEDARTELIDSLKAEAKTKAQAHLQEIVAESQMNAQNEARKIVIQAIQRIGTEQAIDNSVTVFNLENDDIKGRIIGREGRNIRAIEGATGVEIIVDDTPESIVLSCFDPVRREIARLSLHKLVSDGRIHPGRIEEVVAKTRKEINEEIIQIGKKTIVDLGVHGLHPELVKVIGRMKYRSSYGQNLLQHSREVAHLAGTLAAELGLNAKVAKRAGLLHDIGKVPEQESELPHALLGMKWAERYGESKEVMNAIGAHHDEIEMTSLISPLIQVADAISGARPGARRQLMENYIKRLKDLESTALAFDGVEKAYAIQAGRELRVMVESDRVDDTRAEELSYLITDKIQNEMTYPGQVKVTVIRETRAVAVAK